MGISFTPVVITSGVVNATGINDNFNALETALADAEVTSTTDFGSADITPDGSRNGTIAHSLGADPDYADARIKGDTVNDAQIESTDSSNLTVRIFDASGADVTSGTYTVYWIAKLNG